MLELEAEVANAIKGIMVSMNATKVMIANNFLFFTIVPSYRNKYFQAMSLACRLWSLCTDSRV